MTERPPLRFAMIGAGWWATTAHLPALHDHPDVELVAVVDPDPDRARAAADSFDVPDSYSTIDELLAARQVDAVVVATPHTTHFPIASTALSAGVSVLVEKPLTTTAQDAWRLVELQRETGAVLALGATYQYPPAADRVREAVQNDIGELVCVNGEFSSTTISIFSETDPDANRDDPGQPHGITYSDPALSGGGQGQTQLSHVLGSILYSSGRQAIDVFAMMSNRGLTVDIVDALTFRLDGDVLCVTSSPGTTKGGTGIRHRIRYHGTEGMVEHDMVLADAWLYRADGTATHFGNPSHLPSYNRRGPVDGFVDLLRGDGPNRAPGDLAAASASLIDAAYESARTARLVPVHRGTLDAPYLRREESQ